MSYAEYVLLYTALLLLLLFRLNEFTNLVFNLLQVVIELLCKLILYFLFELVEFSLMHCCVWRGGVSSRLVSLVHGLYRCRQTLVHHKYKI